jgi:sulfoacetaldehyde acetyltransferase
VGAKIGQPDVPVVGFAGDGAFGISVNELTAIGRGEWPAITQIVFRNYQWGAEKRNSTLWTEALATAIKDQMENGVTTLIEAMINQELGDPFRRDAMKKPVEVAGIKASDMQQQAV